VTTAIIVASEGAIIPEPLQIAEMVTSFRRSGPVRAAILMRVSVVRIASAAPSGSGRSDCARRGARGDDLRGRQPVADHAGRGAEHRRSRHAQGAGHRLAHRLDVLQPFRPVSALAFPLFTTTACIPVAGNLRSASSTGAARAVLR